MAITNIVPVNSIATASGDGFALTDGNQLNVFGGAYVLTSDTIRSGVYMTGNSSVMTAGTVFGNLAGIYAGSATAWKKSIAITETGHVSGAQIGVFAQGVTSGGAVMKLTNQGTIQQSGAPDASVGYAIETRHVNLELVNSGSIISANTSFAYALRIGGEVTNASVFNSGLIAGRVSIQTDGLADIAMINTGTILGDVYMGSGNLAASLVKLSHSGIIDGDLSTAGGTCEVDLSGGTVTGDLYLSALDFNILDLDGARIDGNIIVSLQSIASYPELHLRSAVGAHILGSITTSTSSPGNDTLDLAGAVVHGNVATAGGNDEIVLRGGIIRGSVFSGDGDDLVSTQGGGRVRSHVNLGAGNDTFLGGEQDDTLRETLGDDLASMGDGDDRIFLLTELYQVSGNCTFLGGAGSDWLDASFVDSFSWADDNGRLWISLEEGLVTANSDNTVDRVGFDQVSGFENVLGGAFDDMITGDGQANILWGGDGGDTLFGMAGNDTLKGDAGDDLIVGGSGRDILTGGAGSDFFEFRATGDSKAGTTTRDLITDFEQGTDLIGLFLMDARPDLAGVQSFTFAGMTSISGAGTVRARAANDNTLIEINLSGSNTAEIAILLRGTFTLTADDFVL